MTVLLPAAVADANWFLLASAASAVAVALLLRPPSSSSSGSVSYRPLGSPAFVALARRRAPLLWALLFLSALMFVLGAALEVYHSRGCPNSDIFHYEVEELARFVLQLCGRQNLPFWVAFGNLLFVLRGQKRIPAGDTDSDVGVPKRAFLEQFPSMEAFADMVWREAVMETGRPAFVSFLPERDLVQIFFSPDLQGSHADIWLYREETDAASGRRWLVNDDRTVRGKRFPYDQVFPLKPAPTLFLNEPVTLPRNATHLAIAEYGASFMTPLTTRLECIENVVNGYTFYKHRARRVGYSLGSLALAMSLAVVAAAALQIAGPVRKKRSEDDAPSSDKDFA